MDYLNDFSAQRRTERSEMNKLCAVTNMPVKKQKGVSSAKLEGCADGRITDNEVREILQGAIDLHVHPGPYAFPETHWTLGCG